MYPKMPSTDVHIDYCTLPVFFAPLYTLWHSREVSISARPRASPLAYRHRHLLTQLARSPRRKAAIISLLRWRDYRTALAADDRENNIHVTNISTTNTRAKHVERIYHWCQRFPTTLHSSCLHIPSEQLAYSYVSA
jgi:hypothetical protein